jgi:hypothetical protein
VHVEPEGEHGSAETDGAGAGFVVARAGWDRQGAVAGCSRNVRHEGKRVHATSLDILLQRPPITLLVWKSPERRPSPAERRDRCALRGRSDRLRLSPARSGGAISKWVDLKLDQHGSLLGVDCSGGTSQGGKRHCPIDHKPSCLADATFINLAACPVN